jgi:hypothetical protein
LESRRRSTGGGFAIFGHHVVLNRPKLFNKNNPHTHGGIFRVPQVPDYRQK